MRVTVGLLVFLVGVVLVESSGNNSWTLVADNSVGSQWWSKDMPMSGQSVTWEHQTQQPKA
jgi:hypothetical protein